MTTNTNTALSEYPPLPEPYHVAYDDIDKENVKCFAEGQMRAYADAARAMLTQAAPACKECDGSGTVAGSQAHFACPQCKAVPAAVTRKLTKLQRKAIVVCFTSDKVSVSEVQRKLSISYADAQTLCQSVVDLGLADELELAPSLKRGAPAPQAAPVARGAEQATGARCKVIANCKSCQHSVGRLSCALADRSFDSLARSSTPPEWCPLPLYIAPYVAPVAQGDAEDAARYRWLRDPASNVALVLDKRTGYVPADERVPSVGGYHTYEYRAGEELDAAIDAARSQAKEGGAA